MQGRMKGDNAGIERVMNREQLLTVGDLLDFRKELLSEIERLLQRRGDGPLQKQWLRTSEVRKMLSVSPGTLQNLRIHRKLTYTKVEGIIFYRYEDIIRLLEDSRVNKE